MFDLWAHADSGRMVGYTEVIQDGHRADQYPEVGLWGVITAPCGKFWEDYGLTGIS